MIEFIETKESNIPYILDLERHPENKPYIWQWEHDLHLKTITDTDCKHLLIYLGDICSGYVILAGLKSKNKSLEIVRIVINEKGKGLGFQTLERLKKYTFEVLEFHRLWLDVREKNSRAKYLYEKCGFVVEGKIRDKVLVSGKYESVYLLSILEHEYLRI